MDNSVPNAPARIVVSPSQIQYTLITPHDRLKLNEFFKVTYSVLKSFPKDLLQLRNSLEFFKLLHDSGMKKGLNLFTFPEQLFMRTTEENFLVFDTYSKLYNKDLVKVFLIDSSIGSHENIANLINQTQFGYFMFIGDPGVKNVAFYDESRSFSNAHELIGLIESALPDIDAAIEEEYGFRIGGFDLSVGIKAAEMNPVYPTMYATTNYFILNQIIANYWLEKRENIFSEKALSPHERGQTILKQMDIIDQLHHWAKEEKKPVTPIEPYLPVIIIIAPFHFPRYGKLLKERFNSKLERMLFRISQTEQLPDYTFGVEEDLAEYLQKEQIASVLSKLTQKLIMLDNIGYLHAQLSNSPLYRLPIIGKSLKKDLSHFQNDFSNKKNAIRKIDKIGELMREKLMPDELRDIIKQRNRQLVFISDLPMEWLKLDKYPLLLTHDVCRVPEFNDSSLLNNYIHNQRLSFRIKPDILKRTLIIHCANENDDIMQKLFRTFEILRETLGFISVICESVVEIAAAVKRHKPDLLIFDCHGGFDEKDLSSYLVIDNRKKIFLTGEDIIKHNIAAPLVFISACSTMPNYGYVKFLTDAFFQAGAFTVTATYLPIKMIDAAVLIVRILNNLKQQEANTIFSNWLAFISHTLRSVLVFETVRNERERNNLPATFDEENIAKILLELMYFPTREQAFENLQKYLKTINPSINIVFENLEHEWLSYTTIGRADLIHFENWLHKHQMEYLGSIY